MRDCIMTESEHLCYQEGYEEGCSDSIKNYESTITDHENAYNSLREQYDELRSEMIDLTDANIKLSNKIDNNYNEISSLISTIRGLQNYMSKLSYENKILKRKLGIKDDSTT